MSTQPNNTESIVVSLEKARELEEAGWPQEKPFLSYCNGKLAQYHRYGVGAPERELPEKLAAPTAEEILRRLPKVIDRELLLQINTFGDDWNVGYWNVNEQTQIKYQQFADTLSNAAASMWIYLSKNNLLPKA